MRAQPSESSRPQPGSGSRRSLRHPGSCSMGPVVRLARMPMLNVFFLVEGHSASIAHPRRGGSPRRLRSAEVGGVDAGDSVDGGSRRVGVDDVNPRRRR